MSTNPADIRAGELLYQAHCQSCHGYQGQGGQTSAPALVSAGAAAADFYLTTGRMPLNNPANQPLRHRPYFNPLQIRQLVAYVNALPVITDDPCRARPSRPSTPLCPTATPDPDPGCVTLSQGQQAFAINCAPVPPGGRRGRHPLQRQRRPQPAQRQPDPDRRRPSGSGRSRCRCSGPSQMSDQEMSAIAHYVQYLHHPADPGGLGISHFGPVAEGFVGVIIGFGLLWFAVRMIGTRG